MKISSISGVEYRVTDLDKTLEFYESVGFRMGKREEGHATVYVNWFWLRFVPDADGAKAAESAPALYLKVDDIDDFYGGLLANGFSPLTEPRKQRSAKEREFILEDPDGYKLAFFAK